MSATARTEPCPGCGALDALGRHYGDCDYAIHLGLPRLAAGEEPIAPDTLTVEQPDESRGRAIRHEAQRVELWMSWRGGEQFDAVIFGSEIEALRHAVAQGWSATLLTLGKPIREQIE